MHIQSSIINGRITKFIFKIKIWKIRLNFTNIQSSIILHCSNNMMLCSSHVLSSLILKKLWIIITTINSCRHVWCILECVFIYSEIIYFVKSVNNTESCWSLFVVQFFFFRGFWCIYGASTLMWFMCVVLWRFTLIPAAFKYELGIFHWPESIVSVEVVACTSFLTVFVSRSLLRTNNITW